MRGRGRVAMQPINKYSMLSIKKLGCPPTVHIYYCYVRTPWLFEYSTCKSNFQSCTLLKDETRIKTDSVILNKFWLQQCFNTKFSIHFGFVWNQVQYSLLIKIDAAEITTMARLHTRQSWLLLPTEVNSLVQMSGLRTRQISAVWTIAFLRSYV